MAFKFEKHPAKKGKCPSCAQTAKFRYYEGLPREYGKCDRVNDCGYWRNPAEEDKKTQKELQGITIDKPEVKEEIIYPDKAYIAGVIKNRNSNFHTALKSKLQIPDQHFKRWGVGEEKGATCFLLSEKKRVLNVKKIYYKTDVKRDKDKTPFYLKNPKDKKHLRCLYGLHLLSDDKIICLVESEKTAFIASFFYPQFDWLATGSASGLTDSLIEPLYSRKIFYLCDADAAGRDNSTIKKLNGYKLNWALIDLFPDKTDGADLADFILEGLRPEIVEPEIIEDVNYQELEFDGKEFEDNFLLSDWERVEKFIQHNWEIRYNLVANKCEAKAAGTEEPYSEIVENTIYRQIKINTVMNTQKVRTSLSDVKTMLGSDFVERYNPLEKYFEGLTPYDKETEPDYINNLAGYLPVTRPEWLLKQFKKMFVRCVSCSLIGTVNKQAFVLVHASQNSGKSTFVRWLCPPDLKDYIAENIHTDKDSLIAMCTNFIVNMDELATLNRAEINALKSVMSKDVFKGRLPYAARETLLKRRANIFGSTNNVEFLNDETGSVRWLCFELKDRINFDYMKDIDINRVWAQAYALFKEGYRCELSQEEVKENELINNHHRITTTEQELVQAVFKPSSKDDGGIFKTATEIKIRLFEKFPYERLNERNVGKALAVLGFHRETLRRDDMPVKGYYVQEKFSSTVLPGGEIETIVEQTNFPF